MVHGGSIPFVDAPAESSTAYEDYEWIIDHMKNKICNHKDRYQN
jgi:hypothetical protein